MANEVGMGVVGVLLRPGDTLLMRPCTFHYVVTLENSLCHGSHFYCASTMGDTCYGILHTFTHPGSITNQPDTEHRATLARMVIFWRKRIVDLDYYSSNGEDADMVEDVLNIKTFGGFLDFLGVYNIIVLGQLIWYDDEPPKKSLIALHNEARTAADDILAYIDKKAAVHLINMDRGQTQDWTYHDDLDPLDEGISRVLDIRNKHLTHQVLSLHHALKRGDKKRAKAFMDAVLGDMDRFPRDIREEIQKRLGEKLKDPSYHWLPRYREDGKQWAMTWQKKNGHWVIAPDSEDDPYSELRNAARKSSEERATSEDIPPPYSEQDMSLSSQDAVATREKGKKKADLNEDGGMD
ncbi:hypothetical protein V5O48_017835, partial [Marasmius crinis-equi]